MNFQGHLAAMSAKSQDGAITQQLKIRHTAIGEVQTLVEKLQKDWKTLDLARLFLSPIHWDKITLPLGLVDTVVSFDVLEFHALVRSVTVTQSNKNGETVFTYDFLVEKEVDEEDKNLVAYLNAKEQDEMGKSHLILYSVNFEGKEE